MDLLGYTLNEINDMYDEIKCDALCHELQILLSFDDFANIIKTINVNKINTLKLAVEFEENGYDFGEFVRRCIISEKKYTINYLKLLVEKRELYWDLECFLKISILTLF